MIDKLTPAQEKQIPVYLEKYRGIGLSTNPCDRIAAESAVKRSYAYLKLPEPEIMWRDSPWAGAILAAQMQTGGEKITSKDILKVICCASYGSFEAYWAAFYNFVAEQLPVKKDELSDIVKDIVTHCGVYWTFKDLVILTEKPIEIHMENNLAHNDKGLFLKYKDGYGVCCLKGKRYSSLSEIAIDTVVNK